MPEGHYHFGVVEFEKHDEASKGKMKGSLKIVCEVLACKNADLIGKKHTERIQWPSREMGDVARRIKIETFCVLCIATKLTTAEEIDSLKKAGKGFNPEWIDKLLGLDFCGEIKCDEYDAKDDNGVLTGEKRKSFKLEKRMWPVGSPKVAGFPVANIVGLGQKPGSIPDDDLPI